ncbi:MAG: hypothetical protein AAF420_14885 [Pseudomonadota bacterium]
MLAAAYPPPSDPLTRIHYDLEVAGYCGLTTQAVGQGFQRQLDAMLQALMPDQETLNKARSDAWQAAHKEWNNRGLGGFRAWCKNEGAAAAARFL